MRLLHVADLHLERPFVGLAAGGMGQPRRAELREAFRRVLACAIDHQVDALCIAGDLYEHENAGPDCGDVLAAGFRSLESANVPVLIAPGNHDPFVPGCLYQRTRWPGNVTIFKQSTFEPVAVGDGVVWGCAFTAPERTDSPLAGWRAPASGLHVGLVHADLTTGAFGASRYAPLRADEIRRAGLHFAMLGHIHAGQVGPSDDPVWAYPGSLEPLDVSETGVHGALLLDITAGEPVRWRVVAGAERRVLERRLDVSEARTLPDLREALRLAADADGGWTRALVRLTLVGHRRGELSLNGNLAGAVDGGCVLSVDDRTVARWDDDALAALAGEPTARGTFVKQLLGKIAEAASDDEQRTWRAVLDAGLAAFEGQEAVLR